MLIASLIRHAPPGYQGTPVYAAAHPFDGELLTGWHFTITQVDDVLQDLNDTVSWGLNTAAYAGESDVPPRLSKE